MKKPYACNSSTGNDRISAKISVTVTVVVNGSPIPSVTGRSPCGGTDSRLTSRCRLSLHAGKRSRTAGAAVLSR